MNPESLTDVALNPGLQADLDLDVAVVGAGVSGLYTAYRVAEASGGTKKLHIFELSDRIGGRLESVVMPGLTISAELGGMRYLTSQQIVTTLIEKVFSDVLQPIEFPMGDPADLIFYLRQQRFRANAWDEAQHKGEKFATRYYLRDEDVGLSADQLFNRIFYEVLMADPWVAATYGEKIQFVPPCDYAFQLSAYDWDQITPRLVYNLPGPYQGMKVNDLGFWNLIKDCVGEEGYRFLDEAGGYYSNTINWNAAQAFPYMVGDFSNADTTYKTILGGYDRLAYALAQGYLGYPGSTIWSENGVRSIERTEGGPRRYRLSVFNRSSGSLWTVLADQVVLAMPRRSLELLDQDGFLFAAPEVRKNIRSVIKEPSFKLIMGFETPWWKVDFGATAGHSITDLPMRQCYYFGTDSGDSHSLFLASYNDMRTVTFWKALDEAHPERYAARNTRLLRWGAGGPQVKYAASAAMVAESMNQVRELHGDMPIPDPFVAMYRDWSENPFGAGYHAWKAGYPVWNVMPFMRAPVPGEDVHVCGEAYSTQQGWVEGAFCVAEKMLQDHFGLPPPQWLPSGYYLGW